MNTELTALRAEIKQVKAEIALAVRKKASDSKLVELYEQLEVLQLDLEEIVAYA